MKMHVNYEYELDQARRITQHIPTARVLDYGCGAGDVVRAGREKGLNFFGAEVFHGGASQREAMLKTGMLGHEVREIHNGKMDFADGFFDLIVSNQVLEHVQDFDSVVSEFERVLKPGGRMLHIFPSISIFREPHIGLPMVHWFPKGSSLRYRYAVALRAVGLGFNKGELSVNDWAKEKLIYIDEKTFYHSMGSLIKRLEVSFDLKHIEDDYVSFRLRKSSRLAPLRNVLKLPFGRSIARITFRPLGGVVLYCERRNG